MNSTITVSDLQKQTPKIVREIGRKGLCGITRNGRLMAFLISREKVEAMIETMEILGDSNAMKAIRDFEAGRSNAKYVGCLDED